MASTINREDEPSLTPMDILPVSRLAIGSIVLYDVERLNNRPQEMRQKYQPVFDELTGVQKSFLLAEDTYSFVTNSRLARAGLKYRRPYTRLIIKDERPQAQAQEYVRECGLGIVLPSKTGQSLCTPSWLYREKIDHTDTEGTWMPSGITMATEPGETVEAPASRLPFRNNRTLERINGLWLYVGAAAQLQLLQLQDPGETRLETTSRVIGLTSGAPTLRK